jgi:hypothetical protein
LVPSPAPFWVSEKAISGSVFFSFTRRPPLLGRAGGFCRSASIFGSPFQVLIHFGALFHRLPLLGPLAQLLVSSWFPLWLLSGCPGFLDAVQFYSKVPSCRTCGLFGPVSISFPNLFPCQFHSPLRTDKCHFFGTPNGFLSDLISASFRSRFSSDPLFQDLRRFSFSTRFLLAFAPRVRNNVWIPLQLLASLVTWAESSSYRLRSPLFGFGSGSILSYLPH